MRLAWLTDLHLNFVNAAAVESLAAEVRAVEPDAVLVGGDTGEARDVFDHLTRLAGLFGRPVYFVLGNHDFYRGSVAGVRSTAASLAGPVYLPAAGVVRLTARTALVGHDGWGDGSYGNATTTPVVLNDFRLIEELRRAGRHRLTVLRRLGEEAATHFHTVLPAALREYEQVVVLTHVPPFREAAWHEGRPSDDDWLPFFACRAAGAELRQAAADYPDRTLTVLCGHTHGAGECRVLPNLSVSTGGAEYGRPRLQRVIEVP